MRTICVVTATRAEYGLLRPVVQKLAASSTLQLQLVATGAHLCPRLGETVREIEADGVPIAARLPIFVGDENEPVAVTIARTITVFDAYFSAHRPDAVLLLGDRFEIFAAATAAARGISQSPISRAGMLRWARPMNTTATASPKWQRCIFRPALIAPPGWSVWAKLPKRCFAWAAWAMRTSALCPK